MAKRFEPPTGRAKWGDGTIIERGRQFLWIRSKTVRLADGTSKRRRVTVGSYPTREEAEAARRGAAPLTASELERLTWDEWLTRWLREYTARLESRKRRSYAASLRRSVELHLKPRLGRKLLAETTPFDIGKLWDDLLDPTDGGLARKTVMNIRGALSLATREALARGYIGVDLVGLASFPDPEVKDPEEEDDTDGTAMHVLEPEEARQLWQLCLSGGLGVWSGPTLLALDTGCRRGEALGIRWQDVDLDGGQIRFRFQMLEHSGEPGRRLAKLKTDRSKRTVSITEDTVGELRALLAGSGRGGSDLVFVDDAGESLSPDAWTQTWRRQFWKQHPFLAGLTPHDLRHTHASLLLRAGESVLVVSERLGHKKPSFTMDRYLHAIPQDTRRVAQTWQGIMKAEVQAPPVFQGTTMTSS